MKKKIAKKKTSVKKKVPGKKTDVEDLLLQQIKDEGLILPDREYKFLMDRRFKFDFAWPTMYIAVEVEGGIWTGGRHIRPLGYESDCEKYSLAAANGWHVIRATSGQVRSGKALEWIKLIFDNRIFW